MSVLASRPLARWLAPIAVVAVILGGGAAARALASGAPQLPARSASALLADLATAQVDGVQGTVTETADLGLPQLPTRGGNADFQSLISGTHTLKVWSAGPDKVRVAVLGDLAESDLIRNGTDLWLWSSAKNTAAHATLPTPGSAPTPNEPNNLPTTPQEAANEILALVGPSTSVAVGDPVTVAGRSAYQLVVAPKDSTSLVHNITIAVDSANHVPLRVQVYAKNYSPPAFAIGFTQVSFSKPADSVFAFTPPAGAKVTQLNAPMIHQNQGPGGSGSGKPKVATTGSAWTTIVAVRIPAGALGGTPTPGSPNQSPQKPHTDQLKALLQALPTVTGPFGHGKLVQTRLVTALILDDGRIIIGAVDPAKVVAAASDPKLALPK